MKIRIVIFGNNQHILMIEPLQKGVLIRHLILPGFIENSLRVMDTLEDHLPGGAFLLSLLGQYTPIQTLVKARVLDLYPSLKRPLFPEEFDRVWNYLTFSSLEEGYVQDPSAAGEEAISAFDGSGISGFI